jgi:CRP/FNR family cyclic AMP-dependent transcriptional regulator
VNAGQAAPLGLCHVLGEDPDLAAAVPESDRAQAIEECLARVVGLPNGVWDERMPEVLSDGIGLLVLDGLLLRRVEIEGRFSAELLGQGDLLRPWQDIGTPPPLQRTTGWLVIEPARVALLDERTAESFAHHPQLTGCLVGRALDRSRNLAVNMAIVQQTRTVVRLHMLFWHLADRWGRVRSDGIAVPLRLTHAVLADLVAARRPTVTTAVAELARLGQVRLVDDVWLLSGDPPGELLAMSN